MKIKIVCLSLALASIAPAYAQAVITSYADVFPATESRLGSLSSVRKVEDTAVASATYASFATKVVFPDSVTSVTFSVASFGVIKRVNGVTTVVQGSVNMAASKFNPEGDVSLPSIFARDSSNNLIVPVNSNLVGTAIANPKSVLITEQKVSLPQLVIVGDYWELTRTLAGTYTVGSVVTPFSITDQSAKVIVVNETSAPVADVTTEYPNNPQVISVTTSTGEGGVTTITATGVTVGSYNKTWWMETSTDLDSWSVDNTATVSPNVVISFPFVSGDPKRFWRIMGLQP